jgi:hypothetical protein
MMVKYIGGSASLRLDHPVVVQELFTVASVHSCWLSWTVATVMLDKPTGASAVRQ